MSTGTGLRRGGKAGRPVSRMPTVAPPTASTRRAGLLRALVSRTLPLLLGLLAALPWALHASVALAGPAVLAPAEAKAEPGEAEPEAVAPDSPRASMTAFMDACRKQDFALAAQWLEPPRRASLEPHEYAERLCAVLQSLAIVDVGALSSDGAGESNDGLARNIDVLTTLRRDDGTDEPVRLSKRTGRTPAWVFDRTVVAQIDAWYGELDDIWFREHLPAFMLRPGPRGLLWWQWLALPGLMLVAWIAGSVLARLLSRVGLRVVDRNLQSFDSARLRRLRTPLTLLVAVGLVALAVPWLRFGVGGEQFVHRLLHGLFLFGVFWALARAVDLAGELIERSRWAATHSASRSLVPLGRRIGKVVIVAIAVVALLAELGYPITSLLAGLGIGGLAIALAAQKTVENLFGAFSIGADQPFREGDFIKVGDVQGTVEAIGLRSTKIRTNSRTVVTIPNGKLAEMQLESYAARDRIQFKCNLGLLYSTTAGQLRTILSGIESALHSHASIWSEGLAVHVVGFGDSAIDVEVVAWFTTTDWEEFLDIRQEMLLTFAAIVEEAGSGFAFPTRTVHLVGESARASNHAGAR